MEAGFAPLRVRITVDNKDGDYVGSLAASENFSRTSEHMAMLSKTDSVSPLESFKELFTRSGVSSIAFKRALRQLNELNSGVASLDTSLLESTSEAGFRFRVMEIALSNHLSLGDEVVHNILNALSPIVREKFKQDNSSKEEAAYNYIGDMPIAKLTSDDDDNGLDDVHLEGCQETSGFESTENGRGLPFRVVIADESVEQDVYNSSPFLKLSISTQTANPEVEVQQLNVLSDDKVNQAVVGHEHAKGDFSMCSVEPDLMQHCARHTENRSRTFDENDPVKIAEDTTSCGLIEADANEFLKQHVLQMSVIKSRCMHEPEPEGLNKDDFIFRSADGSAGSLSAVHRQQQLEAARKEARQSLDTVSMLQIIESISTFEHAFESTALSAHLKAIKDTLWTRHTRFEEKEGEGLKIKGSSAIDNLLYENEDGVLAGRSEVMFVNEREALEMGTKELVLDRRLKEEEPDNRAAKPKDGEEATEPTDDRILSLKYSTAPATGMPLIGNARPSMCVQGSGLGRYFPSLFHASQAVPWTNKASGLSSLIASKIDCTKRIDYTGKKLRLLGVKFLRLVHRLEQSVHDAVVSQVLYRLELIQQLRSNQSSVDFIWKNLMALAEKQEARGEGDLDFQCTILVIGKSGVGKSATLNSLFDETKSRTDAYNPATKKVNEIFGTVRGIKLRVIDTPGFLTSFADQKYNHKIMSSVKHYIKKSPPDIVLYFDRLDMQCRDHGDLLLLQTMTDILGRAIWYNAIVVLTHGSSSPPDGADGLPMSHELFVAQRSHVIQQTIRQAAGDMQLMNPVSLVENHTACWVDKAGLSLLLSSQAWKPQLLLLCFASKILAEADTLMKLHVTSPEKAFWVHPHMPTLPFLLSSMLQSRAELKLRNEEVSDPDEEVEEDDEYNELSLLDKEQRRLYKEELHYRDKLFMKKQLKDDRARQKELKRQLTRLPKEASDLIEEHLNEAPPAAVSYCMPQMTLPPSFDSGSPIHRYRFPDLPSQWLVQPILDTHGWDCDIGYDGLNLEKMFVVSEIVPVSVSGIIAKEKRGASVCKIGNGKVTQAGKIGNETESSFLKKNKTTCGISIKTLADTVAAGMKVENCSLLGKRLKLVMNGGVFTETKDVAYGGSLELSLMDKDYSIRRSLSTIGLSMINWHGNFVTAGNFRLQVLRGKTLVVGRASLNNKKACQISLQASSSDQLQMTLIGMIPLLSTFIDRKISG